MQTLKCTVLTFALLILGCAPEAQASLSSTSGQGSLLYDNTTGDTGDTVFYFAGPFTALGDQIQLISAGTATQAEVEMFNNGNTPGTFNAELDLYNVGSPVGSLLGSSDLTGIVSVGGDVIDMTFNLGAGVAVPQDLVFAVTVSNMSPNLQLGVDMFEPPTVGSSDPTFLIANSGGVYSQLGTNDEDVYFQLSGTADASTPEPSTVMLLGIGLLVITLVRRQIS
jgi:PEP-CTERM motif